MSETITTSCAYTYTVKRGDSFYLIARRLGVPLRDLMNANASIHPSRLMVGDVLCIPSCADHEAQEPETPTVPETPETPTTPETPETPENPPVEITPTPTPDVVTCPENRRAVVQEGQTVADLQLAYDRSYHTLEAANPQLDLDELQAGQTVCIPAVNLPCALPPSVVLGEGETLDSLAVRFNLPVATLLRANPCLAPDDFDAGVTVKLPQ